MAEVITSFDRGKRVSDYLKDGQHNLIVFYHGLGDLLMFYPAYRRLKDKYKTVHFDLGLEEACDFHNYFEDAIPFPTFMEWDKTGYDYVFILAFPMSEEGKASKVEMCCRKELGLAPPCKCEIANIAVKENPLVAVHFQGTCLPGQTNPDSKVAKRIWNEIEECGYIPIEVHFEHVYANPVNKKFRCVNRDIRNIKPSIAKLTGLIKNCGRFIGVASGPFVVALSMLPQNRVFFLEKKHKLECYTKLPISKVNVMEYNGEIESWLKKLD